MVLSPASKWRMVAFAPVLLVLYANWSFVWNHFYTNVPYLHDSGWFAFIVFRDGIILPNPEAVANEVTYYWGWHVSPLLSAGSLLSYAFPGDRVDWYAVFQALVYAPLGCAVPLLVPPGARTALRSALAVAATSIAFAFSGQVVAGIGYPHFELFSSGGLAIMLGALATGRGRLAWVGLAMSVATREDGGLHAGMLVAAVLASGELGRPFPIARRRLIWMAAVAFGATALASFVQKRFFVTPPAWEMYLVGKPPFAHLSWAVVAHRVAVFAERCAFVWAPILVTVVVAAVRRDARYLLGWAAAIPWFLLNFTAKQDLKSAFGLYTGFPFVGSAFWVAAYARVSAEEKAPVRAVLWPLAAVSVASFAGLGFSSPGVVQWVLHDMVVRGDVDAPALRSYARTLRADPRAYGRLLVDASMAAWTVETVAQASIVQDGAAPRVELADYDGFTFFENGLLGPSVYSLLANGRYVSCGRLTRTRVMFCARAGAALPPGFLPVDVIMESLRLTPFAHREAKEIGVAATPGAELAFFGPFLDLERGRYEAVFRFRVGDCAFDDAPAMTADVYASGSVLAHAPLPQRAREVVLPFEVVGPAALRAIELRGWSGACGYTVEAVDVRPR